MWLKEVWTQYSAVTIWMTFVRMSGGLYAGSSWNWRLGVWMWKCGHFYWFVHSVLCAALRTLLVFFPWLYKVHTKRVHLVGMICCRIFHCKYLYLILSPIRHSHKQATFKHVAAMALVPVGDALLGNDVECSSTDLARAWEGVPELRRRATRHQLVARMMQPIYFVFVDTSYFLMGILVWIWYAFNLSCSSC